MLDKKEQNMSKNAKKVAIILFNLGGPDSLKSVKHFLFNLFNDKYIIRLPKFFRFILAFIISRSRNSTAKEIYSHVGGKSPILEETEKQKVALDEQLSHFKNEDNCEYKSFIAMRHWKPFAKDAILEMLEFNPDEIILLPLYPQLSTTTSISSIEDFKENWSKITQASLRNKVKIKTICCYPDDERFIESHSTLLEKYISKIEKGKKYKILFSAHGLPEKIIKAGDPYKWQVEKTVAKISQNLKFSENDIDYMITYQSRVGPVKWLMPDTEEEIKNAIGALDALIVVPIAFVSEHVETLVELDAEYGKIAKAGGLEYHRVPTLSTDAKFIESLTFMVRDFASANNNSGEITFSSRKSRICPRDKKDCPCKIL